jgi:hypothetical protein
MSRVVLHDSEIVEPLSDGNKSMAGVYASFSSAQQIEPPRRGWHRVTVQGNIFSGLLPGRPAIRKKHGRQS